MASITKIMTLLLTLEAVEAGKISMTDIVPISEHAFNMGGSQIWLEPGEQFTLDELIKAICVCSANDAAVAVAEGIERITGRSADIKWVNDLFYRGKKCCGILTEAAADVETGGVDYLVVGIGLNLLPPEGGWPEELAEIAASIFTPGEHVGRCRIAAAIADELLALCTALPDTSFMAEYRARNLVPGRDVDVIQNGERRPAHALAITDDGHLLVRLPGGGQEELSFGEVSIRFQ